MTKLPKRSVGIYARLDIDTATNDFLEAWRAFVVAVPRDDADTQMKITCNAIWQIFSDIWQQPSD